MRSAERGVSLIELVLTLVVASVGIAIIGYGFINASEAARNDNQIQAATRYAHDCAEHVLGRRRVAFANVAAANPSAICNSLLPTLETGYSRTVAVTGVTLGQSAACPTTVAGICRRVDITVTAPSGYEAGVSLLIVNY